jgi:hypothetical protein
MLFIGRETEVARIEAAMRDGRNVILQGKYGIGRTALVREIARRNSDWRCVFADFGVAGGMVCASILAQLLGRSRHAVAETRAALQLARAVAAYVPPKRIVRVVIVLDNVAKVTRPKVELLKMLRGSEQLLVVAILERFVTSEALMRTRVALDPAVVVRLDALDVETSIRFFAAAVSQFALPWCESDIALLARTTHGYPLEMVRTVQAARRRAERVRQ